MRVYILTYKLYLPKGGSFKYAANPEYEEVVLHYSKEERTAFIKKYQWAKTKENFEIDDIRCYFADADEITPHMDEIIKAI